MNIYESIKQLVPMRDLLEHYGFEINRSGFIKCPFHDEDTASMKVYDTSCYCFGCCTGGDVISFTARLFHLKNSQAALKINRDFGLNLSSAKTAPDHSYLREQARKKQELEKYRKNFNQKSEEFRKLFYGIRTEEDGWKRAAMQARLDYLEFWFSQNEWR